MLKTGLVWFRNDLRTNDNYSLYKAVSENDRVIAMFCFDPRLFEKDIFGFRKTEKYRTKFLLETIAELKQNLEKLNISLLTYQQMPENIVPKLIDDFDITTIYLQKEWTDEEVIVADQVKLKVQAVNWVESYDQFLFHPDDLPFTIQEVPKVFTNFRKQCEKSVTVRSLVTIDPLPVRHRVTQTTNIPTLKELGFEEFTTDNRSAFPFKGGENQGLARIHDYFWSTKNLSYYKKTRNGLLGINYSSKLSAWLANGSISPRYIYFEIQKYQKVIVKNDSTYWLIFELIWRDFFKYISMKHRNDIFKIGGILHKDYEWSTDQNHIDAWIQGETKEDFVNANMVELQKTGWMSNRGRQNVASFFAKELKLDWRIGAAYFESLLIDYDVHSNYGNWLYIAGVGNDPRDRKFNIKSQSERYDPKHTYKNLWLQSTLF
ncbi:DASH family cryptochrome [Aquimarina addita]|uniref:Cryptochrome DASH n=1 Tax=Aquimarina addita TaxID=870485 RepID=A0ABP6USR6_9FLAO